MTIDEQIIGKDLYLTVKYTQEDRRTYVATILWDYHRKGFRRRNGRLIKTNIVRCMIHGWHLDSSLCDARGEIKQTQGALK